MTIDSTKGLESVLSHILESVAFGSEADAEELEGATVNTFNNSGLLTREAGIVIKLANGAEFQLTIVQSGRATTTEDNEPCPHCQSDEMYDGYACGMCGYPDNHR